MPPQQRTHNDPSEQQRQSGGRRPVLPPRGGPRAELPGGNPQPRVPSWSDENAQPHLDAPRGHEEPESVESTTQFPPVRDDRQGPGATAEFARPDYDAPRPAPQQGQDTGQFVRPDVFGGAQGGGVQGGGVQHGDTGQYARPQAPQIPPAPQGPSSTGQYERPLPARPSGLDQGIPAQPAQQDYLPPASEPGDGRTPLYDTLETNWFHGQQQAAAQQQAQQNGQQQAQPQQPYPAQPAQGQQPQQHLPQRARSSRPPRGSRSGTGRRPPRRLPRRVRPPPPTAARTRRTGVSRRTTN
ncbi:hypothetical protein V2W30_28330 [Streptomyces sp. Q6]|uniref:Uncharacterized protein n=1 Tax=Streptomyces citrinus TaxID=3118173 RepID=A0ACD5AJ03_9ACTN